jgi:hypothetical protein
MTQRQHASQHALTMESLHCRLRLRTSGLLLSGSQSAANPSNSPFGKALSARNTPAGSSTRAAWILSLRRFARAAAGIQSDPRRLQYPPR